jgi:hypothetical protein
MPFIEAPSNFYLGRYFNPENKHLTDEVVYYESRDLTTHMVVVGMTGSGKTGLCITILEEAALDGIPAIIIDPKGDITNLLLAFPDLQAHSFQPWINMDDAHRAGLSDQEYAQDIAQRWREGLDSWGIGPERVAQFKNSAQFNLYTPGSDAGLPISILATMRAPRDGWAGNEEYHREHIRALTSALLALIGISANPVKDREHVLIANIFEYAWRNGIDLNVQDIIMQVQKPPFEKLGVLPLESFFPEKDRFKLALELNNIIAAPSFQSWLQGEPLDFQNLLYAQTPQGPKPRINIFYIAHLSEEQRSFIMTLILESVLASMRRLSGTSSLRAIVYIDEVFGHFPPYPKNPPTKDPILRLLKQGRAFGIGTILATQNPGDLDYKGLSNAGTWFLGRLQTENDKKKVMDGLATVANAKNPLNLADLDALLSSVDPRVFVMNNIHDPRGPSLIHSRWAMSFLSGPLTRQQITNLTASYRGNPIQPQYPQQQYGQQPMGNYGMQQGYAQQSAPPPSAYGQQQGQYQQQQQYPQQQYQQPQFQQQPSYQPPPAPFAAPPPPPSLPEAPILTTTITPPPAPPPPSLPESTSGLYPAPNQYQPPAAPYQGSPDTYAPQQYQPPTPLPGNYGNPAQQYQPPTPPAAPYPSNAPNTYTSTPYTSDTSGYSGSGGYSPAPYQPASPTYGTGPTPSPFGGTGNYTPNPTSPSYYEGADSQVTGGTSGNQPQQQRIPKGYTAQRPVLISSIDEYFLPAIITLQQAISRWERQNRQRASQFSGNEVVYTPFLLAQMQIRYLDRKTGVNMIDNVAFHIFNLERTGLIHWDQYQAKPVVTTSITNEPQTEGIYGDLSPGLSDRPRITELKKEIVDYIYKTLGLTIPHNPTLKIYGTPGMSFRDYQSQVIAAAREQRDKEIDAITAKFEREFDRLEERYRREERELRADQKQFKDLNQEQLVTAGEAVLSLLKGRTAYTLSRVSRTRRYKGQAESDVSESYAVLSEIEAQMDDVQHRFEYELQKISDKWNSIAGQVEEVRITPYKKDIHQELFGVGWMPQYLLNINDQLVTIPAWEGGNSRDLDYEQPPALGPSGGYTQPYQGAPQSGYGGDYGSTQNQQGFGNQSYYSDQGGYTQGNDRGFDDGHRYPQDDVLDY